MPYIGDLAKFGKLPKYVATLENAVTVAKQSAAARARLLPIVRRIGEALELLPEKAGPRVAELRRSVDEFLVDAGARLVRTLPDIRHTYTFRKFERQGRTYRQMSGRLGVPGRVKTHRSQSAQSAVSSGMGDDAGHLIGDRFGAPGGADNLALQNWQANRYGTYKQLEDSWAAQLQNGVGIDVTVTDVYRKGETRPFKRAVRWTEIHADGHRVPKEVDFGNFHTARSRHQQGIDPTVTAPQVDNVLEVDFDLRRRTR